MGVSSRDCTLLDLGGPIAEEFDGIVEVSVPDKYYRERFDDDDQVVSP